MKRNVIFIVLILLFILLLFYVVHKGSISVEEEPPMPYIEQQPVIPIAEPVVEQIQIQPPQPPEPIPIPTPTVSITTTIIPVARHIIRHVTDIRRPRLMLLGTHRRQLNQIRNAIINATNENLRRAAMTLQKEDKPELPPPATVEERFQRLKGHAGVDKQNVHEPTIRKVITQKLLHLVSLNKNYDLEAKELGMNNTDYLVSKTLQSILEIKKAAVASFNKDIYNSTVTRQETDEKLHQINEVLQKISNGYPIVMKDDKAYREDFILNQIWDRVNDDANKDVRESMQTAFINNILDCVRGKREPNEEPDIDLIHIINTLTGEEFSTYCINGRVTRLMATFTHLDVDPILSKPIVDADEASNEAYDKACHIYTKQMDAMPEDLKKIYNGDRDDLSKEQQEQIEKFDADLKSLIEKELRSDYETLLEPPQLTRVISRAQAVVI